VRNLSVLPVDAILPAISAPLRLNPNLVIEAEPGAGKTTRVPRALLSSGSGQVLVLEPRRIAARLAARRVAWEMDEELGQSVGYQVRFERVAGPKTRLHFVTEGVLTRRLFSDPSLDGVDAVVLDEFHERHLESDLALALLKRLQQTRIELKIIVMSATLDAAPIAAFLNDCPILRSEGRVHELAIEHLPYSPQPLDQQVKNALAQLLSDGHQGDTLVFLPGAAEIRRTLRACEPLARANNLLALPLHGDLSPVEQDRVVAPSPHKKLIVATNVAESSVTIDGVTAVIDSGLARIASCSHWTGLPTLEVGRVSKASATQRAGRAGRTGPGRVLRLYSQMDFQQRREFDAPEIARMDLAQLCLTLRSMGIQIRELDWLDAPPATAVENAEDLLDRLGATRQRAADLMRFPLHPRLARSLAEAQQRGVGDAGCAVAALLGSGVRVEQNDLLAALDHQAGAARDERYQQQLRQLRTLSRSAKHIPPPNSSIDTDDPLLQSVLAGFPDRVARRKTGNQVMLSTGITAELAGQMPAYPLMVALDIEDRSENALPLVRLAARVEAEWLLDLFPERMKEETKLVWNRQAERVDAVSRLLYDQLVLEESNHAKPDPEASAALLAEKAIEAGIERFIDPEALEHWLGRLEFAGFETPNIVDTFKELASGLRSFSELRAAARDFFTLAEQKVDAGKLRELAPLTLKLKHGRPVKVQYERGKQPWIASRLQDFFGMKETPRIGPERTPVVLHLLAPNHRAVQTTTDLAGFWLRLYPTVRRELMRRYPKHAWPELTVNK
jgi:ATP-dependent helicase HrpB